MEILNNKKGSSQVGLIFSIMIAVIIVFSAYSFKDYLYVQQKQIVDSNELSEYIMNKLSDTYVSSWNNLKEEEESIGDIYVKTSYTKVNKSSYGTHIMEVVFNVNNKEKYIFKVERSDYNVN